MDRVISNIRMGESVNNLDSIKWDDIDSTDFRFNDSKVLEFSLNNNLFITANSVNNSVRLGWYEYDTSYDNPYKERYIVDVFRKNTGTTEVKVYNQFDQTDDTPDLTKYVSIIAEFVENIDMRFTRLSPNETDIEFNFDKTGWQNPLLDPITQPEKNYENNVCIKYLRPKYLHSL